MWRRKRWRKGFSQATNNQKAFAEASDPASVLLFFSFSPYSKTPKPPRTNDASLTQDTLNMRRNSKALPWVCRTRGGEPCVVFVVCDMGEDRATAMFVSLSVSWSERFPFGGMVVVVWWYGTYAVVQYGRYGMVVRPYGTWYHTIPYHTYAVFCSPFMSTAAFFAPEGRAERKIDGGWFHQHTYVIEPYQQHTTVPPIHPISPNSL